MNAKFIQISGIALTVVYGLFVVWIYWASPKNLADFETKARESVTKAASKASVVTNTYEIDKVKFQEGLVAFRSENFIVARDRFQKSDPEKRDARVQYYIAYTFYRQGWGRFSNDDELFLKGLKQLEEVKRLDSDFKADDPDLRLARPVELENEFREGLRFTASDLNPFKIGRERK
ncbi:MAG: hypothetical protein HKN33_08505 [Pyrinomonadaceae bacterium]|nr:hypothetical protein [Pyrinomonadaceae bacterium]